MCVYDPHKCAQIVNITHRRFEQVLCNLHCRQRTPVGNALSSSGTSQLGIFDIQGTTKCKYYDHIVLFYLESSSPRFFCRLTAFMELL